MSPPTPRHPILPRHPAPPPLPLTPLPAPGAQAAIRPMVSEEPGSGQAHTIEARRWIAAIRRANPAAAIEIRWCPFHKGVAVNHQKADEWAKVAVEEPDTRGMEWLQTAGGAVQQMPLPRSFTNFKQEISEKKWAKARKE